MLLHFPEHWGNIFRLFDLYLKKRRTKIHQSTMIFLLPKPHQDACKCICGEHYQCYYNSVRDSCVISFHDLNGLQPLCCPWFPGAFLDTGFPPVKDPQEHQHPTSFTAQALNCPKLPLTNIWGMHQWKQISTEACNKSQNNFRSEGLQKYKCISLPQFTYYFQSSSEC